MSKKRKSSAVTGGTAAAAATDDVACKSPSLSAAPARASPPDLVTFSDIAASALHIKSGIKRTELIRSRYFSELVSANVWLKLEIRQETGSFKERGALNALHSLTADQRAKGVICASAGNHAMALAYHSKRLDIRCTVIMPLTAPVTKVHRCQVYGAHTIQFGDTIAEAKDEAQKVAEKSGAIYINGYNDYAIIAGAGTCGVELVEQLPNLDVVVVPVGGGGLCAGVALAVKTMKPDVEVVGVESPNCASMTAALAAGHPVASSCKPTLADGLAVPTVGDRAFTMCQKLVSSVELVPEGSTAVAILRLVEEEKLIVEGAGAIGAGALAFQERLRGKNVALIMCGGNIDTSTLGRVLDRGLASDGRLLGIELLVDDRPGGLADLTQLIARIGASVKDLYHERAFVAEDLAKVNVRVTVETKNGNQAKALLDSLNDQGYAIQEITKPFNHYFKK